MIIKDDQLYCLNDFGGCRSHEFELLDEGFYCTECGSRVQRPRLAAKIAQKQLKEKNSLAELLKERA